MITPAEVDRRLSAARIRLVDDIVVHQRRRVDDLHDRAKPDRRVTPIAASARRQQQKRRAQALAAALLEVVTDCRDGVDGADRVRADLFFDSFQVRGEQVLHLATGYRRCIDDVIKIEFGFKSRLLYYLKKYVPFKEQWKEKG